MDMTATVALTATARSRYRVRRADPRGTAPGPYLATITATGFATRDDDRYICDRSVATAQYELVNDGSQCTTRI